ncbi:hypothetical protein VW35_18225 [Devosia soli]|uniref:Uncharacterized protein n=1 Tax=Devosia soli TaxID=361041 RepID=A0A0F5L3C1_9HYPH|nr:hypothetical protein [Devosia soli]KKB76694.1 hypothetical protein VW35_18225 [Devosia soli]
MAIVFLPTQPGESVEYMLSIDTRLVAAVDKWRAERAPEMEASQAVEFLLREALATEGYFDPANETRQEVLLAAFQQAAAGKSS